MVTNTATTPLSFESQGTDRTCSIGLSLLGSKDGSMVRTLASHQSGLGSVLGVDVICGLSLLLVLFPAPRIFLGEPPIFLSPQKPMFPNSNSVRKTVNKEPVCGCATEISTYLFCLNPIPLSYFNALTWYHRTRILPESGS